MLVSLEADRGKDDVEDVSDDQENDRGKNCKSWNGHHLLAEHSRYPAEIRR